jgi:CRP-like cAMP-binding protein
MERSAAVHTRELGLLRRVPFLAALPPFALERLAQAATWTRAPAGTRVITQGEPGDAFYLAASGSLVVEVDAVPRPGTLGPGDGFGEIALLRRSPRTATVIACADVDLLVLDAASFLAAVTSSVTGQELAERTANDRLAGGGVDA